MSQIIHKKLFKSLTIYENIDVVSYLWETDVPNYSWKYRCHKFVANTPISQFIHGNTGVCRNIFTQSPMW